MEEKPGDIGVAKQGEEEGVKADIPKVEQKKAAEEVEDVPDPDEDDLDDLDDLLDEFSAVQVESKQPAVEPVGPGRPASKGEASTATAAGPLPSVEDVLSDDDFAKQLQAGMADLIGELEKSPEIQAQFEDIFKQIGGAAEADKTGSSTAAAADSETGASFQETIRRTMERVQASGEQATTAAAAAGDSSDDFLAEIMKQMASGGLDGEGNEEDFSKMLMGMMEQLTNKEILYEPMKELNEKFPEWMAKNRETTSVEDLKRYDEQQGLVKEIVAKFEETTYADSNAADREYIVDRMQRMQAAGSPPSDLVGDMASAQEAFNAPSDESCNPQ